MATADTSMYANAAPTPVPLNNPLDVANKAMALSTLGLQQQQMQMNQMMMQRQMQTQQSVRDAYSNNTDPVSGQLDRGGFLSDMGKNPMTAASVPGLQQEFAATDKAQAEAKSAQVDSVQKVVSIGAPTIQTLAKMPEDQRAAAYPAYIQNLKAQGVNMSQFPDQYDPQHFQQAAQMMEAGLPAAKDYLANQNAQADLQVKQSEVNKNNADQFKTGAEELGKLNEDVNNASSRKTTGMLIQGRDRADRIVSLLQPLPNESPQQTTARLNNYIPQVGTEIGTSLGAIMQGGVPDETIQKELAPTTIQSQLASLNQKVTGNPTGGNQAALLKSYGDIAQKLRDFSASRLQEISDRSKSAYPYANKLFPNEVAKITSPITSPGASNGAGDTQQAGTTPLAQATQAPTSWNGIPASQTVTANSQQQYRPQGSTVTGDEAAQYAMQHNMSLSKAQSFLKGRGYVIGK